MTHRIAVLPGDGVGPEVVAEAILYAAEHPVRELTVGGSGRLLEALDKWLPGLSYRVMARWLPAMQQSGEPAQERGPAGLHRAAGDARGSRRRRQAKHVSQLQLQE